METAQPWVLTSSSSLHNHSLPFLFRLFFPPFLGPTYEPQHRGHRAKSLSPSGTCYCSSGPCSLQGPQFLCLLNLKGQEHPGHLGGRGHYCPPLEEVLSYNLLYSPLAQQSPWDLQQVRPYRASPVWTT